MGIDGCDAIAEKIARAGELTHSPDTHSPDPGHVAMSESLSN